MGQMLIRKLDDAVVAALKARAQANNRSAEAEARTILSEALAVKALAPRPSIMDFVGIARRGRTQADIDADLARLRDEWDHR